MIKATAAGQSRTLIKLFNPLASGMSSVVQDIPQRIKVWELLPTQPVGIERMKMKLRDDEKRSRVKYPEGRVQPCAEFDPTTENGCLLESQ